MMEGAIEKAVAEFHQQMKSHSPRVCRVAVGIFDQSCGTVRTFAESTDGPVPFRAYEAKLTDVPSLETIANTGQPRVINDLSACTNSPSYHTLQLLKSAYRSSLTVPLYFQARLTGFLFLNSACKHYFQKFDTKNVSAFAPMLGALLFNQFSTVRALHGALRTAITFSHHRDDETANHLERMSLYSRLIAISLAEQHRLNDAAIEQIYRFAPLHDIGKVGIPDAILLKPGRLQNEELQIMRGHVDKGVHITDVMVEEFGFDSVPNISMLRNIVAYHHERWDGQGYPHRLAAADIPIESRIVAVADVCDALSSVRPYKTAWSMDETFDFLQRKSGRAFDPDCVRAAFDNRDAFEIIKERYADNHQTH